MSEVTIGVAIIADDCLDQLQRLLPQLEKFDQVVIGWNGSDVKVKNYLTKLSTKKNSPYEWFQFNWRPSPRVGTIQHLRSYEDTAVAESNEQMYGINDWGFSYARNLTFGRIKTTHVLWLDTDDMIGFMKDGKDIAVSADMAYRAFKKIATEAPEDIDVWFSNYVYSRDQYNNPNVIHARERLLKDPHRWRWVYPIHEVLLPDREPKWAMIKDVQIIHYPPAKEVSSADRNLKMLLEWRDQLEQHGRDYEHDLGRCELYIGDTYWSLERWAEAARALTDFIMNHPRALDIEKWQAWTFVAKCQIELNNFEAARAAALAAIDIEPGLCDGYILLAQVKLLTEQDPQDILILLDAAGRMEEPPPQVIQNPLDYSYTIYCITSKCKYLLGQYDAALEWAMKACKVAPGDQRADQLRSDAALKVRERDSVEAAKALYQLYLDFDENEKAANLYEVLPYVAQRNDDVINAATVASKRVRHVYDRDEYVKLYTNNSHWKPVNEEWIDSGHVPGESRMAYVLGRLKQALPNGGRILDVGCSDGFHSMMYAKNGYEVVGVDLDPRCVEIANERASARNLSAKFVHGFFEEMNPDKVLDPFDVQKHFNDGTGAYSTLPSTWRNHFDAVICSEVIEHVQNPQFLMGCLADCAKDNAPIIITTPDEAFDKGDIPEGGGMYEENEELAGHVRVFTQETFEALMKSDPELDVVESHFVPFNLAYREGQGWQVGELRKRSRPNGPIVRFYCGGAVQFSPISLEDGSKPIAGSEIAVINMAREMAKLGCQVVVYSGINGIFDSVFYRSADGYDPQHYSDLFISWRLPTAFEEVRPNATKTILWTHDLYYQTIVDGKRDYIPQEWVDRIDVIFALSNFHKDYLEKKHPTFKGKVEVTRNGIDATRYLNRNIEKVPHRYFYSSDWQRGIFELINVWPEIKAAIPDAELHVAYSFELIQNLFKLTKDDETLRAIQMLYAKMKTMDGVEFHDRLGQQELADLQLSCEAWIYPPQPHDPNGGFLETYCITAVEAQAARCVPISRRNGALPEVLQASIEWKKDTDIVSILKDHKLGSDYFPGSPYEKANEWALSQTWESLAVDWLRRLAPTGEN